MNFGPINRRGGERRLNVIFSRARHHIAVVSTIDHTRITNVYNDGAATLKQYLQHAECCSVGDVTGARAALLTPGTAKARDKRDPVVADIARSLRVHGWEVAEAQGSWTSALGVRERSTLLRVVGERSAVRRRRC